MNINFYMGNYLNMSGYSGGGFGGGVRLPQNGGDGMESPDVVKRGGNRDLSEDGECKTCENRKYVDGSDDPGVSFKTPTKIKGGSSATAVMAHEKQHVTRERASAHREDRVVISQSVRLHNSICPECGDVYVSGGVTETTTAKRQEAQQFSDVETGKYINMVI